MVVFKGDRNLYIRINTINVFMACYKRKGVLDSHNVIGIIMIFRLIFYHLLEIDIFRNSSEFFFGLRMCDF